MKKVLAYVSGDVSEGLAACARIERWAARGRRRIAGWHVEATGSAEAIRNRSALRDAVVDVRSGVAKELVVLRWESFGDAISAAVVDSLVRLAGGTVIVVERPFPSELHEQLLEGFETFAALSSSIRVRAAYAVSRTRHESMGVVPWGFELNTDGRTFVPNEREQRVVAIIRHMRETGFKFRQIVAFLKKEGFTTRRGKPISYAQIYRFATGSHVVGKLPAESRRAVRRERASSSP